MKSLYELSTVAEIKERMAQLGAGSERLWGKMDAGALLDYIGDGAGGEVSAAIADRAADRGNIQGAVFKR